MYCSVNYRIVLDIGKHPFPLNAHAPFGLIANNLSYWLDIDKHLNARALFECLIVNGQKTGLCF